VPFFSKRVGSRFLVRVRGESQGTCTANQVSQHHSTTARMKQTRRQRQGRRPAERQRLTNRNITTATFPTTECGLRRSTAILPTSYCNIPDNGTWPATIHCNPTYYLSDVPHVAPESFFFWNIWLSRLYRDVCCAYFRCVVLKCI
jgi:hypothetical protein